MTAMAWKLDRLPLWVLSRGKQLVLLHKIHLKELNLNFSRLTQLNFLREIYFICIFSIHVLLKKKSREYIVKYHHLFYVYLKWTQFCVKALLMQFRTHPKQTKFNYSKGGLHWDKSTYLDLADQLF